MGSKLFYEMRYVNDILQADFVLNKKPNAKILLTGDNFGCGSSREHAPWALIDFGISCVIAESFADIFYNNCFENGILPIILTKTQIVELQKFDNLTIDLEKQMINENIAFEVDSFKKHCLLNGLDSIGLTMDKISEIQQFEITQNNNYPWL